MLGAEPINFAEADYRSISAKLIGSAPKYGF
jgi:hypothetical protein